MSMWGLWGLTGADDPSDQTREAALDLDDYRMERHRQEVALEGLTGGHPADIADHFARGGEPLITYKDWLKNKKISDGEQAQREGPVSHETYTPDADAWGTNEELPSWVVARFVTAGAAGDPSQWVQTPEGYDHPEGFRVRPSTEHDGWQLWAPAASMGGESWAKMRAPSGDLQDQFDSLHQMLNRSNISQWFRRGGGVMHHRSELIKEKIPADRNWLEPDSPFQEYDDVPSTPVDYTQHNDEPSGDWYHVTSQSLTPGTKLVPGGGHGLHDTASSEWDQDSGMGNRRNHVWLAPNIEKAMFWQSQLGPDSRIHQVHPGAKPQRWNMTGSEGWVVPHAHVIQDITDDPNLASLRQARVEMPYIRNNGGVRQWASPDDYSQKVEPWGRYMSDGQYSDGPLNPGWERGTVGFENPMYMPHDDGNWKQNLSQAHGGLTGRQLSDALLAKGHDGVITHDRYGIGEIVDLRPKDQRGHQVQHVAEAIDRHDPKGPAPRSGVPSSPGSSRTAEWDGTTATPGPGHKPSTTPFIARGMDVSLPDDDHDLFHAINEHRATPEHMKRLLTQQGPNVGVWWGTYSHPDSPDPHAYGNFDDFEAHAGANEESVAKYHDSGEYHDRVAEDGGQGPGQIFASTPVVMVGKRPQRGGAPWDPELHNPADSLMGNSYLDDNEPVDLHEVHYHSGRGWVKVPMQGHQVLAFLI